MGNKLELVPGWEILKRISEGTLKEGSQYKRMNDNYPISLFVVGDKDRLEPSVKSFTEDVFFVLKENAENTKEEALKIAATQCTREEFISELHMSEYCPSAYGLFDWCGQACDKCIRKSVSETNIKFIGE